MVRDITVMLGLRSLRERKEIPPGSENSDVAKLFFDSFSNRVGNVEAELHKMSSEFEKLKLSVERNQISDLVLLERLQRAEGLIKDTLTSLRTAVETAIMAKSEGLEIEVSPVKAIPKPIVMSEDLTAEIAIASHVLSPTGQLGSLPSITTPTELQVLTLLASEGPKSAPEIGKAIGRSREHTARLMKKLYEEGYTRRDQTRIPFRYSVVDRLKQSITKAQTKDERKEPISVPQA
jgi:DNA-binding MarR family transcriptional regulator